MECMREETFGPTLPIMKVARRRGGRPARQRLRRTGSPRRCGRATRRAARRSPGGSRPASSASTTPRSTTSRSSCRWAAGRRLGPRRRHGAAGSASTAREQSLLVTRFAPEEGRALLPVPGAPDEADQRRQAGLRPRPARRGGAPLAAHARRSRRAAVACVSTGPTGDAALDRPARVGRHDGPRAMLAAVSRSPRRFPGASRTSSAASDPPPAAAWRSLVLSQGVALLLLLAVIAGGAPVEHDRAATLWAAGSG